MKKRFTDKDLLLILGILVAVIVVFTTVVYSPKQAEASQVPVPKKTSAIEKPVVIMKKLLNKVVVTVF